jgi:hypothetical protein
MRIIMIAITALALANCSSDPNKKNTTTASEDLNIAVQNLLQSHQAESYFATTVFRPNGEYSEDEIAEYCGIEKQLSSDYLMLRYLIEENPDMRIEFCMTVSSQCIAASNTMFEGWKENAKGYGQMAAAVRYMKEVSADIEMIHADQFWIRGLCN